MTTMNQLCAHIWIGDVGAAANVAALTQAHIDAVLNVTKEQDLFVVNGATVSDKFAYCQLDQDDGVEMPAAAIAKGLLFLQERIALNQIVLIHCAAGVSRAASMTIAWLMTVGFSWDEAERMVRAVRPIISPHPELKRSVLQFFRQWPYDGSLGHPAAQGGL